MTQGWSAGRAEGQACQAEELVQTLELGGCVRPSASAAERAGGSVSRGEAGGPSGTRHTGPSQEASGAIQFQSLKHHFDCQPENRLKRGPLVRAQCKPQHLLLSNLSRKGVRRLKEVRSFAKLLEGPERTRLT